jgi:hypothetical protein
MRETDALLRELIAEVRALRETVAAAHARSMVSSGIRSGVLKTDAEIKALLGHYFQEAFEGGRRASAPTAPAAEKSP